MTVGITQAREGTSVDWRANQGRRVKSRWIGAGFLLDRLWWVKAGGVGAPGNRRPPTLFNRKRDLLESTNTCRSERQGAQQTFTSQTSQLPNLKSVQVNQAFRKHKDQNNPAALIGK